MQKGKKGKGVLLLLVTLCLMVSGGCQGEVKSLYTNGTKENGSDKVITVAKELYEEQEFSVHKAVFESDARDHFSQVPDTESIVFYVNDITDQETRVYNLKDNLMILNVDYSIATPVDGVVKLVVRDEEGNEYRHESELELGEAGENRLTATVLLSEQATSTLTYELTIDGKLVCDGFYEPEVAEV